jgi:hypothetical protein
MSSAQKNTQYNKKIVYNKDAQFAISPRLGLGDLADFRLFVGNLKNRYQTTCGSSFFWRFDETKNAIIVNNNTVVAENDIYDQLSAMVFWLYQRNYLAKGFFSCRVDALEEYIVADGVSFSLDHRMTYAGKTTTDNGMVCIDVEERLADAEKKIKSLSDMNIFFWRVCSAITIVGAGSMLLYFALASNNFPDN